MKVSDLALLIGRSCVCGSIFQLEGGFALEIEGGGGFPGYMLYCTRNAMI